MTRIAALRADARACLGAALAAVDPSRLVRAVLGRHAGALALGRRDPRDAAAGRPCGGHAGPVLIVGAGKAALAMARGAAGVAAHARGLVIVPHGAVGEPPPGIAVRHAAHPVPDEAGVAATRDLVARVTAAGPETVVLVLLSGGASALLVAPAEGVSLADKQAVTRALLDAGADIAELNAVRKHCSAVKGGGLARAAAGAAGCWTLALSDVVGDDPSVIASGPTVADPSTWADARAVLERRLEPAAVPSAIRSRIAAGCEGRLPDTAKPGAPEVDRVCLRVVGNNRTAVAAAAAEASRRGYDAVVCAVPISGDAAVAGRALAARLSALPRDRPVALIAGGEPAVRVVPGGQGGRAQHLALAAALALAGEPVALLAAGTDGVDGPTTAAGACVDGSTSARARTAGLDPEAALAATDSHRLLAASRDLLPGGPTGTNVADLVVAVRGAC